MGMTKFSSIFGFLLLPTVLLAAGVRPEMPSKGVVSRHVHAFMDNSIKYHKFTARVTDKDSLDRIIKVKSEMDNVRFLRAGDRLDFSMKNGSGSCKGFVRGVEKLHITLFVPFIGKCWEYDEYFRRGTRLEFVSKDFVMRVKEASDYRRHLLIRKEDFLKQLNEINHFLWSYDQKRLEVAADFDKEIIEIEKKKRHALSELIQKKKDEVVLQKELRRKLMELDHEIDFYQIDRTELLSDRWYLDHDQGVPVGKRPQRERKISREFHRWKDARFK
ncbi:MAG: hypothetical protein HOE90_17540 [Bacteriovoracaceae bacterium]|mgnify:CR=1 FL=1|jgi:hypothetical protein|nr:hypothetical protein [Bacteriovoracaceae bacterium]